MTDDIVARLRAETDGATVNPDGIEAADEIERLRAELAAANKRAANRLEVEAERDEYRKVNWSLHDQINALRTELANRDELLREATEKLQPISSLVDMTPSGFPDHDICPIRLGMARDLRELRARIDAALAKEGGDE